jgi:hypothetical protein
MKPNLQVVVDNEGQVHDGCPRCEDVAVEDVAHLESEVRRLRRKIDRLEADKARERDEDPQRTQIIDLIERWKMATGHPRANAHTADRFDLVKARLREGYTVEDLKLAIDGIGHYRYVVNGQRSRTGTKGQRHDRLGICLGGGEQVEKFANLGHQAKKEDK